MAIDIKKLRDMQKDLNKKSGKGDSLFLYSNKLGEENDIRILPPPPKMNGVYFAEQEVWWINGKMYVTNSTFGGEDVIDEEIEKARETKDKDVLALIEKKKSGGMPVVKKERRYLIPILLLDCKYSDDDELLDFSVVDDEAKILVAKPTLMKDINKIFSSRPMQNGTPDGAADRVKGYNMIIGKTGSGKETEYFAMGWNEPMEMDAKYYKKIPDVMEMIEKSRKSDEYLRSVIRNYLYGEEIIEDENAKKEASEDQEDDAPKLERTKSARPSRADIAKAEKSKDEDEPEKKSARPSRTTKTETKKSSTSRSLLDDAEAQLDDLD